MLYLACARASNFLKHLSQHLKIGRVYILKSVFLASTEILGDLATPAHIPTWKRLGSREAAAPPEAGEALSDTQARPTDGETEARGVA